METQINTSFPVKIAFKLAELRIFVESLNFLVQKMKRTCFNSAKICYFPEKNKII